MDPVDNKNTSGHTDIDNDLLIDAWKSIHQYYSTCYTFTVEGQNIDHNLAFYRDYVNTLY